MSSSPYSLLNENTTKLDLRLFSIAPSICGIWESEYLSILDLWTLRPFLLLNVLSQESHTNLDLAVCPALFDSFVCSFFSHRSRFPCCIIFRYCFYNFFSWFFTNYFEGESFVRRGRKGVQEHGQDLQQESPGLFLLPISLSVLHHFKNAEDSWIWNKTSLTLG